jgi:hypothetical protein
MISQLTVAVSLASEVTEKLTPSLIAVTAISPVVSASMLVLVRKIRLAVFAQVVEVTTGVAAVRVRDPMHLDPAVASWSIRVLPEVDNCTSPTKAAS